MIKTQAIPGIHTLAIPVSECIYAINIILKFANCRWLCC